MGYSGMEEDMRLVQATPSKRQVAYQQMEFLCFVHFGMNTFSGNEWGTGKEEESLFHPAKLDARQWVAAVKDAEARGLLLTCKHHDGFCLWPSAYTEHSVKNSPYRDGKGDVVKEVADACREYGVKFGVYLSPWDRNSEYYGMGKAYDDYYVNQLTELLTGYGDVFSVWMDGACGEGANGKVQRYDWERYFEVIRRLQPDTVISICGPDVRWCGNEAGIVRPSEWSVVSADMKDAGLIAQLSQQEDTSEFRERPIDCTMQDIGSRQALRKEPRLIYYPAETDVSIRPGWFYHEEEDDKVRSVENLKELYLKAVGGNTSLLLNIPPDRNGLFHERDVESLKGLGEFIRGTFLKNLAQEAKVAATPVKGRDGNGPEALLTDSYESGFGNVDGERELTLEWIWDEEKELDYLTLKEDIRFSQRVESFSVSYVPESGAETVCYDGTVIGYKKIVPLDGIKTRKLIVRITDARVAPILSFVGVYGK